MSKGIFFLLVAIGGLVGALVGSPFLDTGGASCAGEPGCSVQAAIAPFLSTVALGMAAAVMIGGKWLRRGAAQQERGTAESARARSARRTDGNRLSAVLGRFASSLGSGTGGWAIHDGLVPGPDRRTPHPKPERVLPEYPRYRSGPALGSRGKPTPKPRRRS